MVETHATRIRATGLYLEVTIAYLNYGKPDLPTVVKMQHDAKRNDIIVVPYFLTPGKFVKVDLSKELQFVKAQYPNVKIRVAAPIGNSLELRAAILDSARNAATLPSVDEAYERAGIYCELKANCPLYKTGGCRATEAL